MNIKYISAMNCVFLLLLVSLASPFSYLPPLPLPLSLSHLLCLRAREFPFKHRTLMENLVYTNSLQPTINRICNYNSRPTPYTTCYIQYNYIRIRNIWYTPGIWYISGILHNRQHLLEQLSSLPFFERGKKRKTKSFFIAQTNDLPMWRQFL